VSTNVFGPKIFWNNNHKRFDGKTTQIKNANKNLEAWQQKVEIVYGNLLRLKGDIDLNEFYEHVTGKFEVPMLLATFRKRLEVIESLIGSEYTKSTLITYVVALKHLTAYIKEENKADIALRDVTPGLLKGFHSFLIKKMVVNSANKYMRKLKAVLNDAAENGKIDIASLKTVKIKDEEVERDYLSEEEIRVITDKTFKIERISIVRDLFLFQCYTGLAYADIKELTPRSVFEEMGLVYVLKPRVKTGVKAKIPLMPEALLLLEKYSDSMIDDKCFPVPSNQKFNAYLQEVADLCGISKPLTTHIGRHTFATLMLNNGMHKDYIQEILGLSSPKYLSVYAKMQNSTLHSEIMKVNAKINS
jgi:site-specific recombinase XerD